MQGYQPESSVRAQEKPIEVNAAENELVLGLLHIALSSALLSVLQRWA
jgi:hypothetical protein